MTRSLFLCNLNSAYKSNRLLLVDAIIIEDR